MSSATRQWTREDLVVSTDKTLFPLSQINAYFGSEDMYWVDPYDLAVLRKLIDNSHCFGMYTKDSLDQGEPKLIGFGRAVTDFVSIYYLTDVVVDPEWRGGGIGSWMVECMREDLHSIEHLRAGFLVTSGEKNLRFYEKVLGMEPMSEKYTLMEWAGPKFKR